MSATMHISVAELEEVVSHGVASNVTSVSIKKGSTGTNRKMPTGLIATIRIFFARLVRLIFQRFFKLPTDGDVFALVTKVTMPVDTATIDAVQKLRENGVFSNLQEVDLLYSSSLSAYMAFVRLNIDTANSFRVDKLTTYAGSHARSSNPHIYQQLGFSVEVHLDAVQQANVIIITRINASYDLPQAKDSDLHVANNYHLMNKHFGMTGMRTRSKQGKTSVLFS